MMRRLIVSVLLVLAACSSDNPASGVPHDGDCPEKDAMLSIQDLSTDPGGPGGANVTDDELAQIQAAIDGVPSDC